jgi:hypothetical protein
VLVTLNGVIVDFILAPAHAADVTMGAELLREHSDTVVLAIHGKGQKTRFVKLKDDVAAQLQQLRSTAATSDAPVFQSRKKQGPLVSVQVFRIVKAAALPDAYPPK